MPFLVLYGERVFYVLLPPKFSEVKPFKKSSRVKHIAIRFFMVFLLYKIASIRPYLRLALIYNKMRFEKALARPLKNVARFARLGRRFARRGGFVVWLPPP